jgi:transcriptional regulator with XRE-family HTH domain
MTDGRGFNATEIGRRLRELRATRGLSLRQLAKLIGASPSLLSQVENGKVTPSVDTLYQLAGALAVPITGFFTDAASVPPAGAVVVRAAGRTRIALEHGVTWENLLPRDVPGVRFIEVAYAPGATSGDALLRHPGRTLLVVLAGELVVRIGFDEHRLGPGDSATFGEFEPHQLRNEGSVEARAVVCIVGDDGERPPLPA